MQRWIRLLFAAFAVLLIAAPGRAQTTQIWSPTAWAGAFIDSNYIGPSPTPEVLKIYYGLAKFSIGSTPVEACSNGYIANMRFFENRSPRSFTARADRAEEYLCYIKPEGYLYEIPVLEGTWRSVGPGCQSLAFIYLQLDLLSQGADAYSEWRREYNRSLPANVSNGPYSNGDYTCQCDAGAKLHSSGNFCVKMPDIVIGFFNGVGNTRQAALDSSKRLKEEYGESYKQTPLKYDWFYNQTACGSAWYGKVSCLEDVAEVFEQRAKELDGVFANRWEVFWDILAGRHMSDGSLTGRLMSLLGNGANALLQWLDATANAFLNQLASAVLKLITLFTNSPTYENQADHLTRLTEHADRGSGFVLVAHSQGNLFVNSAYDALMAAKPNAEAKVVSHR
jgi:hypothetical protein